MFRRVSIDLMSPSGYWTPTKYWFPPIGVDPEVLLVELDARIERRDDVLHNLLLGQPEVGRLGPVDVDDVLGVIQALDDPGVDDAVDPVAPRRGSPRRRRGRPSAMFLPGHLRMLIGVDFPSFIAPPDQAAASNEKSRSRNRGSLATGVAEDVDVILRRLLPVLGVSWTLTTASIGPELGVYAADQSGLTPISEM